MAAGGAILAVVVLLASLPSRKDSEASSVSSGATAAPIAERVEIVHFHAATQCWSCKTVGELALKTIRERFPEEYATGTLVFRDINGSDPANAAIIRKFGATSSSLFINAVVDGRENISEDATVWRLVSNEEAFISHLEDRISRHLRGK